MKAKNNYYQTKKRRWYRTIVLLFLLCLYGHTQAQNVTISPKTGKLMAALTEDHEVGFQNGWSSLWRHDQLPLSLTVADYPDLTPSGELKRPAGNIAIENNELVLLGGMTRNLYMEVSLPKGYRITGYTLVIKNNLNGKTVRGMKLGNVTKKMYETNKDFNLGSAKATSEQIEKYNEETKEYTIKRTSMKKDDMGNQLYFCLDKGNANAYFGVTIKHFELHFTAEGDFTEHVAPVSVSDIQSPVSYYEMPFTTSKLDIGPIQPNSKNGSKTYYSYNYKNVADLTANMIIYQQDAVNAQKEAADVATNKHISAFVMDNKTHFGLGNDTYFVETPTTATTTHGDNLLLGYRIVGAKFNCAYAKDRNYSTFTVSCKYKRKTYYLTAGGSTSTDATQAAEWIIDDYGYMRIGNTYLQVNNSGAISVTPNKKMASVIRRDGDNIICGNKYLRLGSGKKLEFGSQNSAAHASNVGTITISKGAPYALNIYDETGKNIVHKIEIKNANDAGTYELKNLNNDAVKFEVSGLTGADKQAVVSVDVTMQALNPFIHSIDIVCHDWADAHPMTQTFTANDFSVRGGKFTFYVPEDFSVKEGQQQPCKFTFENLYSLYGDKTYYTGTEKQKDGNARYVFIESPYDQNFKGLYDAAYDPNADYKRKIKALVSGTKAFRFNNADELGNEVHSTDIKYFNEFPFSKEAYKKTTGGEFKELSLMKDDSEVRYLFTADETRYNISPATATEHRSHAFYVMDIQLVLKQYKPKFTWVPIYTSTCYEGNGKDVEKPQYGLKLGTTEMGESGKMGYLTVDQINKILLNDNEILGSGSTPRPAEIKSPEQVLYVDASDLMTVVYRKATIEGGKDDLDQAMSLLGKNALFYLPENLAPAKNNFATKTGTGEFRACKDIVITDKKPFYAPYNIRVDAAQTATYTREITVPKNGKATFASVMLPFTLSINNDGVHTNEDGSCKFRLSKMNENSCITLSQNEASKPNNYKAKAKFIPLTGTSTKANTPYMVEVLSAPTSDKISFIAIQKGSDVVASTSMANDTYLFKGEAAKGKIGQYDVNFTNYGSYSGKKLNKNRKIFYFSGNMYLCSKNLDAEFPWLYVYPFRAFYEYTGGADAKDLSGMSVIYDDSQDEATGIANLQPRPNLAVQAGNGTITFAATIDSKVNIYTVTGTLASSVNVKAGSTETVNVPAGMYVINGVKVIVK
ncbi:hypothetical protein [Prevotella nigrescens]